jgi:NADPH2:quinone reductase
VDPRAYPLSFSAGVDVVFDPVGGAMLAQALRTVAWGGHYLVIGFASGDIPKAGSMCFYVNQ